MRGITGPSKPSDRASSSNFRATARPPSAPKPLIDIKHIRHNVELYSQNCLDRNYEVQATFPAEIQRLFARWQEIQRDSRSLRERQNILRRQLANPATASGDDLQIVEVKQRSREEILTEAKQIKSKLSESEGEEKELVDEMEALAISLPNLTSEEAPRGCEPIILSTINEHPEPTPSNSDRVWRSHIHIGSELGLMNFSAAATTSGWGWYFFMREGAQLEQALIQFALSTITRNSEHMRTHNWIQVAPPSMVYSHIAAACGFQPRDLHGETQVYTIFQESRDAARGVPEHCLAGTAEIPLAGMYANAEITDTELPLKTTGVSRCYRAEAGARGVDTKGLYRVHEFNKVEMFAWTEPSWAATTEVFDEIVDLQTEILSGLGLHCRVLEMPTIDLGASAARKIDIETYFPSRRERDNGWGEVTSASICTDYQARRLGTRLKMPDGRVTFPWTVNGTALAVPRVLSAILENGWDEQTMTVKIPEVLRPWMDGRDVIGGKRLSFGEE